MRLSPDGYFLWLELPAHFDSRALHAQALGSGFQWPPAPSSPVRGSITTACASNSSHPWSEQLEQALTRLAALIAAQLGEK